MSVIPAVVQHLILCIGDELRRAALGRSRLHHGAPPLGQRVLQLLQAVRIPFVDDQLTPSLRLGKCY